MNGLPTNTDELLRRLLDHDAAAWRELVEGYTGFLLAMSRRTFASYGVRTDGQDFEDAVADVWKNLLENDLRLVRQCIERGNFVQTLQVLVRNRSIDLMRKRQNATIALNEGHAVTQPAAASTEADLEPGELARAMGELTARERTLVNLFFLQRKKYREISALTGIPQNSIGPTLARAVARLRQSLKRD